MGRFPICATWSMVNYWKIDIRMVLVNCGPYNIIIISEQRLEFKNYLEYLFRRLYESGLFV